jgi:uncharacterized membrane protein YbhN (UPF0104 family)
MTLRNSIKIVLSVLVLAAMALFFIREFRLNWMAIETTGLNPKLLFIVLAAAALATNALLAAYGWYLTLASVSGAPITLRESLAVVNTAAMAKYLPGKVWPFAMQTYWLAGSGHSTSLVAFVFLINALVPAMMFLLLGLFCLLWIVSLPYTIMIGCCLLLLILLDVIAVKHTSRVLNGFLRIYARIVNREVTYVEVPQPVLVKLHAIHCVAGTFFGFGAYLVCLGLGVDVAGRAVPAVMASMMISDVIGFVSMLAPGGLGVKEGSMYLILKGSLPGALPLILPVAARLVSMVVDLLLGIAGFIVLQHGKKTAIAVGTGTDGGAAAMGSAGRRGK